MNIKLKNIASVSFGATFRSRIKPSVTGNIRIIQMKNLGKDNSVHLDDAVRIDYAKPRPKQRVQAGDILFRSRGLTNTAAIINEDVQDAIIAAPLLRIHPDLKRVDPVYLLWWINQPSSQHYYASQSKGTMVKMITKQELEELNVTLPPLTQQIKIAEIFRLSTQEQSLMNKLKARKKTLMQGVLMRMATEPNLEKTKRITP
jgi:restriction endonuclease S subunit